MLRFIKSFFGSKPAETKTTEAPYKIETPPVVVAPTVEVKSGAEWPFPKAAESAPKAKDKKAVPKKPAAEKAAKKPAAEKAPKKAAAKPAAKKPAAMTASKKKPPKKTPA